MPLIFFTGVVTTDLCLLQIVANYHPLALRFFLMRTHYRADVNYSNQALDNASDRVYYIYQVFIFYFFLLISSKKIFLLMRHIPTVVVLGCAKLNNI